MAEVITREDVAGLIQEAYSGTFYDVVSRQSAVASAFPTVNMGTKTTSLSLGATDAFAEWVGETAGVDTEKPLSKISWGKKNLVAEEIAVIIAVHENDIDDATEDVLSEIAVKGANALAAGLDAAVLFGVNKPATWTSPSLYESATAAGNVFQAGAGEDDLAGSFLQAAGALAAEGYDPDTFFANRGLRFRLANLRGTDNAPIYLPSLSTAPDARDQFAGLAAHWVGGHVRDGEGATLPVWQRELAEGMIVDPSRVRIGIRQDISVKFLDQATPHGIDLASNDMVALRFKARYAYALGESVVEGAERVTKSPVAIVTPAATAPGAGA